MFYPQAVVETVQVVVKVEVVVTVDVSKLKKKRPSSGLGLYSTSWRKNAG